MSNDLKYGLVLGAVVLLIFVGYYAIRSRSVKEEMKPPVVAKRAEAPRDVDIFATPGAERAPAGTSVTGGPEATMEIGQPAETPVALQPAGPVAVAPVTPSPAGGGSRTVTSVPGNAPLSPPTGQPPILRSGGTGTSTPPAVRQPAVLGPVGSGLTGGSAPVPPVLPQPPAAKSETYKIQKGDTLGLISKKYYGTSDKWQKILDANKAKNLNPNNLVVGTEITIPDAGAQSQPGVAKAGSPTPSASGKTYTVTQGDTLYSISKKFYGDGTQWRKIYDANKGKLAKPDALKVGMTLTIP